MRALILLLFSLTFAGCGPLQAVDWCKDQPILIRSPQPDWDDFKRLYDQYKLKTVINLRPLDEAGGGWYIEERNNAGQFNINLIHIDLGDGTIPPMGWQVEQYLSIVADPKNWPVMIHCQAGIHRTGIMAAVYRMQFQRWKPEHAISEMESHWFDWSLEDRSKVKEWLRNYVPDERFKIVKHECY